MLEYTPQIRTLKEGGEGAKQRHNLHQNDFPKPCKSENPDLEQLHIN